MIAAPIAVQRSTGSWNSSQPASATMGNWVKLIGVSADTSPSFSARVHSMCPAVPMAPADTTHSQVMPCGHSHTVSAGSRDIGTQISVVRKTMRSAGSTCDSCLIWIETTPLSTAATSATSVPALKLALPGRTMTSMPTKPRPTAIQRLARTCSCRNSTAAMVTKIGVEYDNATACARGRWPMAQKPAIIDTTPIRQRTP